LIGELSAIGVLAETAGGSRNRVLRFGSYIDLFEDVAEEPAELAEPQPTRF
jgi:hypothetical protein